MLIRGCHAPVLCTPGDGRNASQGTDLPRAVGEKRRQRHFGILWQSAQSEISRAAFLHAGHAAKPGNSHSRASAPCDSRRSACLFRPLDAAGFDPLRAGFKTYRSGRGPSDTCLEMKRKASPERGGDIRRMAEGFYLLVAPRDLAIFAAPSVISLLPSGKSHMASTPSSDSMNARDCS